MKQLAIAMILFALLATGLRVQAADAEPGKSVDKKLPLAGQVFLVDGHTAFLILPKDRPAGRPTPWVWYAPTLPSLPGTEEKWMFEKFLAAGIAIGGVDAGESYGSPKGCAVFSAFFQELVGKRGMAPQPCLLARSRGGLMLYNWASENPGSVAGIAGIYPVCNLNSYPGMAKACGAYGLTADELTGQLARYNPIDRLAPLAKAKVPVFHIHGDVDALVPLKDNSGELAKRYRDLGGPIELQVAPGQGHNMWTGFFQCNDLVQFVIKHAVPKAAEAPAGPEIDRETLDKWAAPYRGWHYQPNHVLPANPKIPGHEKFQNTDCPCVYQLPGQPDKWYMAYIAYNGGYNSFVCESTDLLHWSNHRLALGFGKPGEFDFGGCVIGAFLYESYDIKAPRILKKRDGKYWTLYGCYAKQGGYEIDPGYEGVASSDDGLAWKRAKATPILSVYDADCANWEKHCIYQPWLVEHDGKFYNFYNAKHMPDWIEQMGMATSPDLLDWKRHEGNPVIPVRKGGYDEKFCSDGKVFRDGDHWVMFYFGVGKGGAHIMVAFSRDLVHWTAHPEPLYKAGGHPGGLDKQYAHKISLVYNPQNDTFYLYYCACGSQGRGIGLITSKPLTSAIQVVPKPRQLQPAPGEYLLTPKTAIRIQSPELQEIGGYLAETMKGATGLQLAVGPATAADGIVLKLDPARQDLGDEGYALACTAEGVTITAPKPAGVFYGIQTLRQLLPLRDEAAPPANPAWSIPGVTIADWPRFPWRGYLLDTVRHFRTKEEVKRTIDLLAFQKLNRLHLHLTDNEGWRVEIKKYPKLTEVGARRKNCSGKAGEGWFYTQAEIRELVAYAASRQVTIVPEIEMPGHSSAALAAYPELGCSDKLSQSLCGTKPATREFVKNVLAEVIELFPSTLIHIGADEVLPGPWRGCPDCGPRMKALAGQALPADVNVFNVKVNNNSGVPFHADIARLQGEFVREIDQFLQAKGRRLIGWDEILDGGLKNDSRAAAMAWRSDGAVAGAIAGNHDVVAALYPRFYLDNNTPLQVTYAVEPVSKEMTAAQAAHVLGVQGNMWGEGTPTIQHVDRRTYPRLCAIAEIGWSAAEPRDFADFKIRLEPFMRRLEALGVTPGAWPSAASKRVSLTTGKPATCSAADPGREARLANDGLIDTDSYWATDVTPGKDAWWQVDLEKPTLVGRVVVVGYYGDVRYYGFTIEGSVDGKAWTQLADRRANTAISTRTGCECTFKPAEIRYLRVTMTGNSVNLGRHLVEVLAFEK